MITKIQLIILSINTFTMFASSKKDPKDIKSNPKLVRRVLSEASQAILNTYLKKNHDDILAAKHLLLLKFKKDIPKTERVKPKVLLHKVWVARRMSSIKAYAEKIKPELRSQSTSFLSSKAYLENLKNQLTIDQKRSLVRSSFSSLLRKVYVNGAPKSARLHQEDFIGWPSGVPFKSYKQLNEQELDKVILNLDRIYPSAKER